MTPDEAVSLRDYFDGQLADIERRLAKTEDNIAVIVKDHVKRDEFASVKTEIDADRGRRLAFAGVTAIVIAVLGILVAQINNSIPSHTEISAQVKTEAPWLDDQDAIEARIAALERSQSAQDTQLDRIAQLNEFFCKTRQPELPGCAP